MHRLPSSKHPSSEVSKPPAKGKGSQLGLSTTRQVIETSKPVVTVLEEETATQEAEETGKGSITLDLRKSQGGITLIRRDSIIRINRLNITGMRRQMMCPLAFIV